MQKEKSIKNSISMLFNEVISFVKQDFNWVAYLYTFIFICAIIFANYHFEFYNKIINPTFYKGVSIPTFFVFYVAVYFSVAIPTLLLRHEFHLLKQSKFYLKSLFFIALYAISIGFFEYRNWDFATFTTSEKYYIIKLLSNLKGSVLVMLPLFIFKTFFDKKIDGLYGLCNNSKHLKVYLLALLVMLPFLVATSLTPDFLSAYPQFKVWHFDCVFNLPAWLYTPFYEMFYALDFVNTELFFRGAMVIGMAAILDKRAILPMAAFYVAIHFGKPMGETISSMFGGYILGILAYQTRHIWGGVVAHIGIALIMEIMGFFNYYVK
ncbi:MAG: CPBP family intramembrane metalloprotease [Prevotellaceae bacterium]|jgi:hypothetical protein|nr:CPBP family intramembrane metalloprotease [Prevotellaceae bacterium]